MRLVLLPMRRSSGRGVSGEECRLKRKKNWSFGSLLFVAVIGAESLLSSVQGFAACQEYPLVPPDHSVPARGVAREADQLVDSVGVNYKFGDSNYFTQWAKDRLTEIGIRHLRGALRLASKRRDDVIQLNQQLGIKYMLLVNNHPKNYAAMTPAEAHDAVLNIGTNLLEGIEGTNEPEYHDPDSGKTVRRAHSDTRNAQANSARLHQQELYQAINSDPQTRNVKVFSPSISAGAVGKMDVAIGNIDSIIDGVNIHPYPRSPQRGRGIYGEPEDPNGTLLRAFNAIDAMGSYSEPVIGTETGYPTQPINPPFPNPDETKAIYMPRLHLFLFNHGLWRAYSYAFIDASTGGSDKEDNFGYLRSDGTPKTSFYAMKNLITLLKDPGVRFFPAPLNYTLSGNTANMQEVLLQKRDGSYYLALWLGKQLDLNNLVSASVTLNLPEPMASIETARPNDSDVWTTAGAGSSINLTVDEKVLLVKLVASSPSTPQLCSIDAAKPNGGSSR
jgi:hypothetical protein